MNINNLKELVKHCIYEEEGITCMNNTYYVDMIHTIENLQSKIDKAIEYAKDNLPERDCMGCLLTDEDVVLNNILEKLLDILRGKK